MIRLSGFGAGLAAAVLTFGCGQGQEPAASGNDTPSRPASSAAASTNGVAIEFHSQPDPPKSGDNTIEVTVRQPDGPAITGGRR